MAVAMVMVLIVVGLIVGVLFTLSAHAGLQKLLFRFLFSDFGLCWLKKGDYAGPGIQARLAYIPNLIPIVEVSNLPSSGMVKGFFEFSKL